ncbi:MAG: hypothetical protein ACJAT3_002624 [Akkermansiaceae bacterium]|jgi:hypothetical protein
MIWASTGRRGIRWSCEALRSPWNHLLVTVHQDVLSVWNTADFYRPSINYYGISYVRARILEWGCFDQSLHIMKNRIPSRSVHMMVGKRSNATTRSRGSPSCQRL